MTDTESAAPPAESLTANGAPSPETGVVPLPDPTNPSIQQSITPAPPPTGSPIAPIENQKSKIKISSRCHNGKVARLPKTLRDQLNQMLLDGMPYDEIIRQLGDPAKGISKVNITNWRAGGYQDWLKEQRWLDECRLRHELTFDLAREEHGIDAFQAAHKMAASLICEAVADIGADSLRQAIRTNPLNLLRMLNSLSRLTSGGLKCERHLADEADRSAKREKQTANPKRGISPEAVKEMQDKLNLM